MIPAPAAHPDTSARDAEGLDARRAFMAQSIGGCVAAMKAHKDQTGVDPNDLPALSVARAQGKALAAHEVAAIQDYEHRITLERLDREFRALTRATRRPPRASRFAGRSRARRPAGRTAGHRAATTTRDDGDPDPAGDTEGAAGSVAAPFARRGELLHVGEYLKAAFARLLAGVR